ncbi:hypothetical protein CcaverHIS002_0110100 [Cutaneotrichosporon cavernicola]|uniref:Uncharacterized protein n=1 Tax=Cutaneotrichosporon cavernicola TaxID=279322 RepID=A0AA48HZD6_9TREE|nr:uncharacterized protein CcaverHIS019_0110040 [Cutaneotrichosporon cavernicola]BEI80481.1 hypothetical protein CcaverHIS002_0110100 [Cutaneotrichosporon cavernicola]BEI88286.1 hypothetical protein CcaverHIS019_0110040 [Cutaneotrichosporon cavernicola]BEI96058.1 hypothetical protein CcaverHIS631_0110070 [Cutaneotrichosporon cavernicola]BEJ03830.1 hypothetical protein CcaverHIS641_0110050 [Cutaneotrichosporon cavernicola]
MSAPTSIGLQSPGLPPYSPSTGLTPKLRGSPSTWNLRRYDSPPSSPIPMRPSQFGTSATLPTSAADLTPAGMGSPISGSETLAPLNACHHILEVIVNYADRGTRATLLRVNKTFFEIAGEALYKSLILGELDWPWMVLRGSLINRDHTIRRSIEMFRHLYRCSSGGKGCATVNVLSKLEVENEITFASRLDGFRADILEHCGPVKDTDALARGVFSSFDQFLGLVDGDGDPYTTNFKTSLLQYTRVVTLNSHEPCFCGAWKPHLRALFPNVENCRLGDVFLPAAGAHHPCNLLGTFPSGGDVI